MKTHDLVIIFLILFLTTFYVKEQFVTEVHKVKSDSDGRHYIVRVEKNSKQAANLLGKINNKLLKLIEHLKEDNSDDIRTKTLIQKYNPDALSEGTEDKNYTSYSINKGEKIVFCLRMRDEGNNLVDENTLTYVAVHELAHVATKEIGHVPIYWENFKWLLTIAKEKGIYKYVNYSDKPQSYCGLLISNNVLDN
jgi:predicted metal-dependent hydrolase|tara:strand:- start:158 stop:739 length:582 start_codon:yes stop_codon:yes gene_type:complete